MKFAIIAAAILSSSAAFAADTTSGVMTFGAVSEPVITLAITNGDAKLHTGETFSSEHIATADITSNVNTNIVMTGTGTWSDLTAFGDIEPQNLLIQTTFRNSMRGDTQNDHFDTLNFEEKHALNAGAKHQYLMSVRTDKMTHAGAAKFESIIQVSAE